MPGKPTSKARVASSEAILVTQLIEDPIEPVVAYQQSKDPRPVDILLEEDQDKSVRKNQENGSSQAARVGQLEPITISLTQDQFQLYHQRVRHPPLLPWQIATVVSSVSMASRVSLRIASLAVETLFNSLKFSAAAALGVTRRALVSAVSSARSLHLMTFGTSKDDNQKRFFTVLDLYTNNGIYAIHASFSLAELLCMSTFHIYSSAIRFTLDVAEESVHIFDGLFGETDTSKALAAFICIFLQELQGQDDALGLTKRFGKIYALGQMAKSMTAYCCLQYLNRKRWRSMVKLHPIFAKRIPKTTGGYDPAATVAPLDMFKTSQNLTKSASLPKLLRRASLGGMASHRGKHKVSLRSFPSSESLNEAVNFTTQRRRYNSGPDSLVFDGNFSMPKNHRTTLDFSETLLKRRSHSDQESKKRSYDDVDGESNPKAFPVLANLPKIVQRSHASPSNTPNKNANYFIKRGARYVKFAVAAYGPNMLKILGIEKPRHKRFLPQDEHRNHYTLANHADIPVENVITSSYENLSTLHAPKLIAPVHYVIVDPSTASVVVCLRGTVGLSDIVTDLTASYDHYAYSDEVDGYVHSGIFHSAKIVSTSSIATTVAEALERYPTYSLVLTGHSLGGGCAALLTMLWSEREQNEDGSYSFYTKTSLGFPRRSIHSYVYACPAVMSAELSKYVKDMITTFVYRNTRLIPGNDLVPCLSLGLVRDFRNITVSFCNEEGMAEGVIGKVLGIFQEKTGDVPYKDDLWYWALLKTLRADMKAEKLYPPGTVYWINSSQTEIDPDQNVDTNIDTTPLSISEVDDVEITFSEIVFSTSMFTDHSPHHYEGSLALLDTYIEKK